MVTSRLGHIQKPAPLRFWAKVRFDADGCWRWTAHCISGYGAFHLSHAQRTIMAHRYAYELLVGPIPDGLQLDHLCRVRSCVNPTHLEPVTVLENVRRGLKVALHTHCKHGHEMTPENTAERRRVNGALYRICRTCDRARHRRDRRRKKLEAAS